VRPPTPTTSTQRAAFERLWRRAEEIRSLCGLPPLSGLEPGAPDGPDPLSLEALVEILLRDLEGNFRRELATRMQLKGLGELMAFAVLGAEPGQSFRILVSYLARALDEPHLWLGVIESAPPVFTIYTPGDPALLEVKPERVAVQWLQPDWLRWIALGKGVAPLWVGPTGSRRGGPWYPSPIRGELAHDHFSDEIPPCPGALIAGASCGLSGAPLEEMAGGHRACGQCEFRHVVGLLGVEGECTPDRMATLEAVVPSLGAILVNLGLKEALDFEARFRDEVIESLPLGVIAVDARGLVLAWNRAAAVILGRTREEVRSQPIGRFQSGWSEALLRCLEQGTGEERAKHEIPRSDGTSRHLEISTAPLRDADGEIRGALATLNDVSSLRSMEERIRQLDRLAALGRFASSVAHEIRNPLTGIATGVQFLSRGFPEGDERHESVAFILREVTRLNTIIQDLFTASRPRELKMEPVDLRELAGRTLRGLKPAPEQAGVTIELEDADQWPTVTADADQLQQVLLNLLQNAVQATPPGGRVTVRARTTANGRTIEVEDTGTGIAPEHLPRVFEPFYTTRPKGTGLGLFVAHAIVQRHQGTLEISSEAGKGTTFRITLPLNPA
jgi:PAS domain S-box-containing protein